MLVSPHYKLIEKGNVFLKELLKEPNNLEGKGSGTRLAVSKEFEKKGLRPSAVIEASNAEFFKDLVKKGEDISLIGKYGSRG